MLFLSKLRVENSTFHVAGLNERGQNLYNTIFPHTVFLQSESDKFMDDSSATNIKEKLSVLKSNDIQIPKEIADNNDISQLFRHNEKGNRLLLRNFINDNCFKKIL